MATTPVRLINKESQKIIFDGKAPNIKFLVASSIYGLLLIDGNSAKSLVSSGIMYGLSKDSQNNWWVFCRNNNKGAIYSCKVADGQAFDLRLRIADVPKGVHQMDFIGKDLHVTDTAHNRILVFRNAEQLDGNATIKDAEQFYPAGKAESKLSINYCNFNSIYSNKNSIYLVAHNYSYYTKRKSQVYEMNMDYSMKNIRNINGKCAHNYYKDKSLDLICDSLGGTLLNHDKAVVQTNKFTRGLSVSNDYYILGGTGKEFDGKKRIMSDSEIYILNKDFKIVSTIIVPNGQVRDIRRLDGKEYSLSNSG